MHYLYFIIYCNVRNKNFYLYVLLIIFYSSLLIYPDKPVMRTSISNLNGDQQNILNHLSKNLKRAVKPLMIICYGHRSSITFQNSAFSNCGIEKKSQSVFDLFLIISDEEILPDSSILEIARRNCDENTIDNLMVFRMHDVLLNLKHKSRFFSGIFRSGILLYGDKNALAMIPHPLPPVCFAGNPEKAELLTLLQQAQQCLGKVERNLDNGHDDPQLNILLLNASAVYALRYFIAAYLGIDIRGGLRKLLSLSVNISNELNAVFPRSTMEEKILFHVINLSFIDEGFCPGPMVVQTLFKRVANMVAVSQGMVHRKLTQLLPA